MSDAKAFDLLQDRGFFYQMTDEDELRQRLNHGTVTFYAGFDPTADSLHVGHLLPIMGMRFLQQCGHRPLVVIGGGTAMVGDPSGKTEMRQMLSAEETQANAEAIKTQMQRYLDFDHPENGAIMVNNADWLADLKYIEFLRDIGKHFSINKMLSAESVRQRLETGLSFLEFNYMLLQAYDFYVLCRDYDCDLQLGGQDQWGNIVAGTDLLRRMLARQGYGATFPLLTNAQGQKFGKTEGGAVWLDAKRTSVFDYYQFWRNVEDADVGRLLRLFSGLPTAETQELGELQPPAINRGKEILAYEATCLAHGEDAASEAYLAAGKQFGFADAEGRIPTSSRVAGIAVEADAELPTVTIPRGELAGGIGILALFVRAGLADSNGAARRLIQGGGAYRGEDRISDARLEVSLADFADGQLLLRAGKKKIKRLVIGE